MAKSPHQIIRESVRRVLREGVGDNLSAALFGTAAKRTALYDTAIEKWGEGEVGAFKFVFTPSADKKTLGVTVEAVDGADARAADMLSSDADVAVKGLAPTVWADLTGPYTYMLPAGVTYKKEDNVELKERWARIAGLLKEAPDAAVKLVKAYDAKVNKGFKSEAEMQAAKKTLATGLKSTGVVGEDKILDALQAGGVGGDGAVSFASELASMQK
jgi:hypothetical protein